MYQGKSFNVDSSPSVSLSLCSVLWAEAGCPSPRTRSYRHNSRTPSSTPPGGAGFPTRTSSCCATTPDQSPVKHRGKMSRSFVTTTADDLAVRHRGQRQRVFSAVFKGFSVRMTEADAKRLSEDPEVALVAEDGETSGAAPNSTHPTGVWTASISARTRHKTTRIPTRPMARA